MSSERQRSENVPCKFVRDLNKAAQERVNEEYRKRDEVIRRSNRKTTRKTSIDFERHHRF